MFENFSLAMPYALLLLPTFLLLNHFKRNEKEALYMPHISHFSSKSIKKSRLTDLLKWCMLSFAVFAFAQPQLMKEVPLLKKKSIDIVLALDTSGSMSLYGFNPKDYNQTRLDVVQVVVSTFIQKRQNDRIGLVVFGTYSSIASPLSFDKEAQLRIIEGLRIGTLGKSTALVDGVVSSIKLLKESTSASKVIIVLSDGEDSSSKVPLPIALKLREKYGIKIYTIIIDKSASNMMKLISKTSHTKAYNPKDKKALKAVYEQIDTLEKSTQNYTTTQIAQPIYGYFLFFSLLCGFALLKTRNAKEVF